MREIIFIIYKETVLCICRNTNLRELPQARGYFSEGRIPVLTKWCIFIISGNGLPAKIQITYIRCTDTKTYYTTWRTAHAFCWNKLQKVLVTQIFEVELLQLILVPVRSPNGIALISFHSVYRLPSQSYTSLGVWLDKLTLVVSLLYHETLPPKRKKCMNCICHVQHLQLSYMIYEQDRLRNPIYVKL